ncbi:MAG: MlaD family protein [Gammaproteobacteria bacterium]
MAAPTRIQTMRAGLFFLVAVVIFAGMALWVAGSEWVRGSSTTYTVTIPHSGTLAVGDPVIIAGVPVGRVSDMNLDAGSPVPVALRVDISPAVSLRSDSTAKVVLLDLLGGTALEIDPGSSRADNLEPGGTISGLASAGAQDLLTIADQVAAQTIPIMRQTKEILSNLSQEMPATLEDFTQLSGSAASVAGRLDKLTVNLERDLPDILRQTNRASVRAVSLLDRAERVMGHLDSLSGNLDAALGERGASVSAVLEEAQAAFREARDAAAVVSDNRLVIERALERLSRAAAALEGFSTQIKERPYSLIRVLPAEDRIPGEPAGLMP